MTAKKTPVAAENEDETEEAPTVADETEAVSAAAADADKADEGADEAEQDVTEGDDGETEPGRLNRLTSRAKKRRQGRQWSGKIIAAVLTVLVVASLSVLGWLYFGPYQQDRDLSADAAKSAIAAASDGTVAILSYSPDTLDHDFSTARSHLTGDFLSYYDQFTKEIVAPAAKQKAVKTTAVVLRAALTDFHPQSATVLLFINQTTQSRDRPEPTMTSSSVLVTLTKANGNWLISQFNPA